MRAPRAHPVDGERGSAWEACGGASEPTSDQPERFVPLPILSHAHAGRFFLLEREIRYLEPPATRAEAGASLTLPNKATTSAEASDEVRALELPRRLQSWRLQQLRQTSPEQLFHRKVLLRVYGDALRWAAHYGMSTDPVRQAQWADAAVSRHSIADFLDKVSDKRWVLDECCRRVPDEPAEIEMLLESGLRICRKARRALRMAARGTATRASVVAGAPGAAADDDETPSGLSWAGAGRGRTTRESCHSPIPARFS